MKELRKRRLRDLIQTGFRGDRKAFMEASGLSKGRIAQLLDEAEPFGDVAVARLESKLSLKGYFDAPDSQLLQKQSPEGPSSDLERDLLLSFRHLPDDIKDELVRDLMRLAIDFSPAKDVFRKYGLERAATASEIAEASLWSCKDDLSKFNKLHAERLKSMADGKVPLDTVQRITADQLAAAEVRIRRASMYSVISSRTLPATKSK